MTGLISILAINFINAKRIPIFDLIDNQKGFRLFLSTSLILMVMNSILVK